ncbi:threonylcarbamoyl-AMP synthase [Anabrus simplex]|uniref:threonylcarbamoyl-AMP synthase n=1 Tax=Anabrus simplex TaxID=316456 RepID=UPI0034DDB66D
MCPSVAKNFGSMLVSARTPSELVLEACQKLRAGSVIAVPTDTIYGLAALVQDTSAIELLYSIKGRDPNKPVSICLSRVEEIDTWAKTDSLPPNLLKSVLPGKVTVVLERKPVLNPMLNPGNPKVGVRVPGSDFLRKVVQELKEPIALTSANRSNEPSCIRPEEFEHIWPDLAAVFTDNSQEAREELRSGSTVVDLSVPGEYFVLRPGVCLTAVKEWLHRFGLVEGVYRRVIKQ